MWVIWLISIRHLSIHLPSTHPHTSRCRSVLLLSASGVLAVRHTAAVFVRAHLCAASGCNCVSFFFFCLLARACLRCSNTKYCRRGEGKTEGMEEMYVYCYIMSNNSFVFVFLLSNTLLSSHYLFSCEINSFLRDTGIFQHTLQSCCRFIRRTCNLAADEYIAEGFKLWARLRVPA